MVATVILGLVIFGLVAWVVYTRIIKQKTANVVRAIMLAAHWSMFKRSIKKNIYRFKRVRREFLLFF